MCGVVEKCVERNNGVIIYRGIPAYLGSPGMAFSAGLADLLYLKYSITKFRSSGFILKATAWLFWSRSTYCVEYLSNCFCVKLGTPSLPAVKMPWQPEQLIFYSSLPLLSCA